MNSLDVNNQNLRKLVLSIDEVFKKIRSLNTIDESIEFSDFINCSNRKKNSKNQCEFFNLTFVDTANAPVESKCQCLIAFEKWKKIFKHKEVLSKLEKIWPLRKGMVNKNILAWNTIENIENIDKQMFAFIIKIIFLKLKKVEDREKFFNLKIFESMFLDEDFQFFYWTLIKNVYTNDYREKKEKINSRFLFNEKYIKKNSLILLSMEDYIFKIRSGVNQEIVFFENFIDDLFYSNCSLIVFSSQKLSEKKKAKNYLFDDYDLSFKSINKEKFYTIEEAFDPSSIQFRDLRYVDVQKKGLFDKLLELLYNGQKFIDKIEQEYDSVFK